MGTGILFYKITPSVIHICFLVILTGHFITLISGFNKLIPVTEGHDTQLPIRVKVLDQHCVYYSSPELLKGQMKQCTVSLELEDHGEISVKQLSFLNPFTYHGFTFHLGKDKKAKDSGLQIIIKHDSGLKFILSGFILLVLLMLWYFPKFHPDSKGE